MNVSLGDGSDTFTFTGNLGIPFNIDCGAGSDSVLFSGGTNSGQANLDTFTGGSTTIAGGTGTDRIVVFDNANTRADAFSVSSTRVDRTIWGGMDYSGVETIELQAGSGANAFNVSSTAAGVEYRLSGGGGVDTFNIGTAANGMGLIAGDVWIRPGRSTAAEAINLNNLAGITARTWTIDHFIALPGSFDLPVERVTGLAGGYVQWDNTSTNNNVVTLSDGVGTDTGNIARLDAALTIGNGGSGGRDQLNFGSPAFTGMRQIAGDVTVVNGVGNTNFNFDDTGDATARTIGLDIVGGNHVLTGMAAGTIRFLAVSETGSTTITTGSGADAVGVRRYNGASVLTIASDDGTDAVRLGGQVDLNYPTADARDFTASVDVLRGASGDLFSGSLVVDNGGDTVARTVAIDFDAVTGFQTVSGLMPGLLRYGLPLGTFDAAEGVVLIDGSGAGSYGVRAVRAPLTIENVSRSGPIERPGIGADDHGGSGDATGDTVTLGSLTVSGSGTLDGITSNLTVRNRYDTTTLSLNDVLNTSDRTVGVSSSSFGSKPGASIGVNGPFGGSVRFVSDEAVSPVVYRGGSGNDVFNVSSTPATTRRIDLAGNGGNDTFNIGRVILPATSQLDPINGPVSLTGGTGTDRLVIDDTSGAGGFNQLTLDVGQFTSSISAPISFANGLLDEIEVRPSAGGDQVIVRDTVVGQLVTLRSGAGNDSFNVQSTAVGSPVTLVATTDGTTGTDNLIVDLFQDSPDAAEVVLQGGYRGSFTAYGPVALIRFGSAFTARATNFGTVGGGLIDIGSGAIVLDYDAPNGPSVLGYVANQIALGRNGGDWLGTEGLTSSAAIANPANVTVGYADAASVFTTFPATFRGVGGIDNTTVLIYTTTPGDVNGDQTVDFSDLVVVAQNYGQSGRTYAQGNLDYSVGGTVDFSDLVILAQHYGQSLALVGLPAPVGGRPRHPTLGQTAVDLLD